ncbi:MAG: hypothetical protein MZV70_41660 [Desulfobacterales bacterium]|nr:hypothetical protein [Desulfobacterales bacterium]
MKTAIDGFGKLISYEVGDVTAAATYYLAEIYYHFSRALTESERPDNLNAMELEQYELAIEEQAFPFRGEGDRHPREERRAADRRRAQPVDREEHRQARHAGARRATPSPRSAPAISPRSDRSGPTTSPKQPAMTASTRVRWCWCGLPGAPRTRPFHRHPHASGPDRRPNWRQESR